jgi:DNA-binding HxlR family transcriptional regulator
LDYNVDPDLILNSPVARALAVIGDRWAFLIIRDAFLGVRRFEAFRTRSGASRGTLSSRLKSLVENGILSRSPYQSAPTRYEYRLTEKGLDLYPCVLASWAWETRWSRESRIPPALTHALCGKNMRPVFNCDHCHAPIKLREVTFLPGATRRAADKVPARFQRRSKSAVVTESGVDRRFFHMLDIIGDRWTGLVVAAMFFGLHRYDEIGSALGIATNILSDRLKQLVAVGVLQRSLYQDKPRRHEYRLTDKGAALYTYVLQMHEWAHRWLLDADEQPLVLTHQPCGADLHSELVCSECLEILKITEVRFDPDFELERAG